MNPAFGKTAAPSGKSDIFPACQTSNYPSSAAGQPKQMETEVIDETALTRGQIRKLMVVSLYAPSSSI